MSKQYWICIVCWTRGSKKGACPKCKVPLVSQHRK